MLGNPLVFPVVVFHLFHAGDSPPLSACVWRISRGRTGEGEYRRVFDLFLYRIPAVAVRVTVAINFELGHRQQRDCLLPCDIPNVADTGQSDCHQRRQERGSNVRQHRGGLRLPHVRTAVASGEGRWVFIVRSYCCPSGVFLCPQREALV